MPISLQFPCGRRLNTKKQAAAKAARRVSTVAQAPASLTTEGVNLTGFWRLYEIHRLISQETYPNCPSIAEHLEVNQRTVERDIERLRDLFGAPIEYDRAHRGYRYTGPFELPSVKLREGEAIALFLGQRLLMQCKGTPFERFVHQAMAKVRMMLPQSIEVSLERVLDAVSFHVEPLRGEEVEVTGRWQALTQAIEDRRTIETDYYTASRQAHSPFMMI